MVYGIGFIFIALLVYGPFLWVKFVLWRHSKEMAQMPGTGGELARHLVERFELDGVQVVKGQPDKDHYNPAVKIVSLSPRVFDGKSLTAVAVAAHEVGHAIQFVRNEPISQLRAKYLGKAFAIKRFGTGILIVFPVITLIFKMPYIMLLGIAVGVITMLASVLMYVAILPEEYDASFNKALPILKEGYVPQEYYPAVRQVLRAAAFTYVAGALADVLRLWRWLRVVR